MKCMIYQNKEIMEITVMERGTYLSIDKLLECREADVRAVDRKSLANIDTISIDAKKTQEERIASYIEQSRGNPYIYEDMGYVVKHSFNSSATLSFSDCAKELVLKRAGIAR